MKYVVYPPIGIARVGNSPTEFFIGPETTGSIGTELTGAPVTSYKDTSYRLRRQAARFQVFEVDENSGASQLARLSPGTTIRWTVKLANKKDAVMRDPDPVIEDPAQPVVIPLPTLDPARQNRHIKADGVAPASGLPSTKLTGRYLTEDVLIGELLTDPQGNLLVLGGHGVSRSPENALIGSETGPGGATGGGYYDNRGWYDDVSDGSVEAEILPAGGGAPLPVKGAWVIVAPPDFAPSTSGVVTLYDVMFQAALDANLLTLPPIPSFSKDIWPILSRAAGLRWVNDFANAGAIWKQFNTNWAVLADPSPASQALRSANADLVRQIGSQGELRNFSLRPWQDTYLTAWTNGAFTNDYNGTIPNQGVLSAPGLTRTVLDGGVGQGFYPGIEAGIIVTNNSIYAEPFRIATNLVPGDLTARMALPWQADFVKCSTSWWPSQRPDDAPQLTDPATALPWIRPITVRSKTAHRQLVNNFGRLGVIVPRTVGGQDVFVEVDRDPTYH